MSYYQQYKERKSYMRLVAAVVYWVASMIFFIIGFSFSNPIVIFGKDISVPLAVALSLVNTIIQVSGNDDDKMDFIDKVVWVASYVLGIVTNYIGLLAFLNMADGNLEKLIAASLGTMIEILPERMLIKFLKEFKKNPKQQNFTNHSTNQVAPVNQQPVYMKPRPASSSAVPQKLHRQKVSAQHLKELKYHPVGSVERMMEEMDK